MNKAIDLRSDTVTRPTQAMLEAMTTAELGDDVLGDDPTVLKLQERMAALFGTEAALFVPSGSMANQTAIKAQTDLGDEIITHQDNHIYHYEAGGPSGLSGCSYRFLTGEKGQFTADDVKAALRPTESHFPQSSLVVVENTHNRGGGSIWSMDRIKAIHAVAREHHLKLHLDGARIWNACAVTGQSPADFAPYFDTMSACFSKGLGAPIGSAVMGDRATIRRCHRYRKMFGGGMRQAGILAAAALHALDHHRDRLVEDHTNARRLAEALADMPHVSTTPGEVETNILYFDVDPNYMSARDLSSRLDSAGVRMLATGPQRIRALTHLDVSAGDVDRAIGIIRDVLAVA